MTRDEALAIVDALYAAALGESDFARAMTLVSDAVGGAATTIEFMRERDGAVVHFEGTRIDPASIAIYLRDYGAATSRARFMLTEKPRIGFDQLFITEKEMDRDPFYADFLAPHGLRYFLAASCDLTPDLQGTLCVQRKAGVSGPPCEKIADMARLWPHVARAMRLFWGRIEAGCRNAEALDTALAANGLTPAERRLAAALAFGEPLPAYARRNGLRMSTVYTHYQRAKSKLDTASQASFIARVRAVAAPTPPVAGRPH